MDTSINRLPPSSQPSIPAATPRATAGPIDGVSAGVVPDPQLAAARQLSSVSAVPVEHLHDGLEREKASGKLITANPDTQMVKLADGQGNATYLIPTYRSALVFVTDAKGQSHPVQQMTGIEVKVPANGPVTAMESISQTPVKVTQDPKTHHILFTTDEGQKFDADPATMNVYVDGNEVHLLPDDPDVMQALEIGKSVVARGTLPDGNLQHKLSDNSVLTFNRQWRALRQDLPDGTVNIMVPAVAIGGRHGGALLTWKPQGGLTVVDLDTNAPIQHGITGDPQSAEARFHFIGQDGEAYSLDPFHLALTSSPAPAPAPSPMPAPAPAPAPAPLPAAGPQPFGPGGAVQQKNRVDLPAAPSWEQLFPHATATTFAPVSPWASAWTNHP